MAINQSTFCTLSDEDGLYADLVASICPSRWLDIGTGSGSKVTASLDLMAGECRRVHLVEPDASFEPDLAFIAQAADHRVQVTWERTTIGLSEGAPAEPWDLVSAIHVCYKPAAAPDLATVILARQISWTKFLVSVEAEESSTARIRRDILTKLGIKTVVGNMRPVTDALAQIGARIETRLLTGKHLDLSGSAGSVPDWFLDFLLGADGDGAKLNVEERDAARCVISEHIRGLGYRLPMIDDVIIASWGGS